MTICRYPFVVFDLDGTLIDTLTDLTASTNHVRCSFGLVPLTADAVCRLVGNGARTLVARALDEVAAKFHDEGLKRFLKHYEEHCLEASQPYPGLEAMIGSLEIQGVCFAVLTNKPEGLSRKILEGLGLTRRFVEIVGGDTLPVHKPDPAGLEYLRSLTGARQEETLLVGDSRVDAETALRGGIDLCGVLWGLDVDGLKAAKPAHLVGNVTALEAVIRGQGDFPEL